MLAEGATFHTEGVLCRTSSLTRPELESYAEAKPLSIFRVFRFMVSFLCFLALVPFPLFTDGGNIILSEWRPLWHAADDRF